MSTTSSSLSPVSKTISIQISIRVRLLAVKIIEPEIFPSFCISKKDVIGEMGAFHGSCFNLAGCRVACSEPYLTLLCS